MAKLSNHTRRTHALLSASSAYRWIQCPPSAAASALYPPTESPFAAEGTLAHEVAEAIASGKQKPEDFDLETSSITKEMVDCAVEYSDYIAQLKKSEDAVVLLEQRVDFSHIVPSGFGTTDCVILQDEEMDVIDFKFGKGVKVDAKENPQMLLYGLGSLNDLGIAYDVKTVRLHIFQPRMGNISTYELPVDELLAFGEEIKPIAEDAYRGKGAFAVGDWCRFCPHAGSCRELYAFCTRTVDFPHVTIDVPVLAPFEISSILAKEPLISLWLKRVKEQAMEAMLNGEKIHGYKVVAGRSTRSWADEIEVSKTLEAAGYSKEDITKTELLTVAAMEKALGKKKFSEILSGQVITTPGAPTVAAEDDKRQPYDRTAEAKQDFAVEA